jgi:hypothetical protein
MGYYMERERYHSTSVYSAKFHGGAPDRRTKSPPKSKGIPSYSPGTADSDISLATLFKENRTLQGENQSLREKVDSVLAQLQEVTSQLEYETRKNKLRGI